MKQLTPQDKNAARFGNRSGRTIVVKGVKWKWMCGSGSLIAYNEKGGRQVAPLHKVSKTKMTPNFGWNPYPVDVAVPKDVEAWLKTVNPAEIA